MNRPLVLCLCLVAAVLSACDSGSAPPVAAPASAPSTPDEPVPAAVVAEPESPASSQTTVSPVAAVSPPVSDPPVWQPPAQNSENADAVPALRQAAAEALAAGKPAEAVDALLRAQQATPRDGELQLELDAAVDALAESFTALLERGALAEAQRGHAMLLHLRADTDGTERAAGIAQLRERTDSVTNVRELDDAQAVAALTPLLEALPSFQPALDELMRRQALHIGEAMELANADRFDDAGRRLDQAEALYPDNAQVQDARAVVVRSRAGRAADLLAKAADGLQRLDLGAAARALAAAERVDPQANGLDAAREALQLARRYGHFRPSQRFSDRLADGSDGPLMVVIPHGEFAMGAADDERQARDNERPRIRVRFERGVALAINEVSVADFDRFVRSSGYRTVAERRGRSSAYDEVGGAMVDVRGAHWRRNYQGRTAAPANHPVVHVAHDDALAYAEWLSAQTGQRYRLPSEAEFEHALRAGTTSMFPWGNGAPPAALANLTGKGDQSPQGRRWGNGIVGYRDGHWGPAPVGSFPVEAMGTFDLAGNVSEWVLDCWHDSYQRAPTDGRAWLNPGCRERVVRGGSWASPLEQARSAYRMQLDAEYTSARIGFRVAREL